MGADAEVAGHMPMGPGAIGGSRHQHAVQAALPFNGEFVTGVFGIECDRGQRYGLAFVHHGAVCGFNHRHYGGTGHRDGDACRADGIPIVDDRKLDGVSAGSQSVGREADTAQ